MWWESWSHVQRNSRSCQVQRCHHQILWEDSFEEFHVECYHHWEVYHQRSQTAVQEHVQGKQGRFSAWLHSIPWSWWASHEDVRCTWQLSAIRQDPRLLAPGCYQRAGESGPSRDTEAVRWGLTITERQVSNHQGNPIVRPQRIHWQLRQVLPTKDWIKAWRHLGMGCQQQW